ncbi:hypothetical protein PX699_22495 [Sphingobium sp. H39-3-25]|uniref:hypothetical protein n=1 Tax=Sphingomonadales TaxID=204457 RepID=UPI00082EF47E|nr:MULTISPECIES: hypothetical protein [Sphingomonadaceae]MDF0491142.1 hypothetical protein [Sphingomonas pollutisoli]MDF0545126.1 hypothetical protein [Sphingobium arseniciresistens]
MKRVERDPEGGWIARRADGTLIPDDDFRWNSRSAARGAVHEAELLDPFDPNHVRAALGANHPKS